MIVLRGLVGWIGFLYLFLALRRIYAETALRTLARSLGFYLMLILVELGTLGAIIFYIAKSAN